MFFDDDDDDDHLGLRTADLSADSHFLEFRTALNLQCTLHGVLCSV